MCKCVHTCGRSEPSIVLKNMWNGGLRESRCKTKRPCHLWRTVCPGSNTAEIQVNTFKKTLHLCRGRGSKRSAAAVMWSSRLSLWSRQKQNCVFVLDILKISEEKTTFKNQKDISMTEQRSHTMSRVLKGDPQFHGARIFSSCSQMSLLLIPRTRDNNEQHLITVGLLLQTRTELLKDHYKATQINKGNIGGGGDGVGGGCEEGGSQCLTAGAGEMFPR